MLVFYNGTANKTVNGPREGIFKCSVSTVYNDSHGVTTSGT